MFSNSCSQGLSLSLGHKRQWRPEAQAALASAMAPATGDLGWNQLQTLAVEVTQLYVCICMYIYIYIRNV